MRLLSFLTAIETALAAEDPSPREGAWENYRTFNYHQQCARLSLGTLRKGSREVMGEIFLQGYRLADGSSCLKASISWTNGAPVATHAIYEKPDLDWNREARTISTTWLNGSLSETLEEVSPLAASA